ncbi:MAG: TolC family protein [Oceanospirillales bacterium]|nr:TolC family protein [Oceanospirillales bacterium]
MKPRTLTLILLLTLLSGCSTLSDPQAGRIENLPIPEDWALPGQTLDLSGLPQDARLLDLFQHPQLKQLVDETLNNNLDLQHTALRLRQQQLLILPEQAASHPELSGSLTSQRSKEQENSDQHALALTLNWELDVWGRLADGQAATQKTAAAQKLDYDAARNSLAARTVQSWLDISLRQQIIETEQQWLKSSENNRAVILDRYQSGLGNLADLATAKAATARVQASLIERQNQQRVALRQLNLLRGVSNNSEPPEITVTPDITTPPISLPGTVLARRPDLQAAYLRIQAADHSAAKAYKQLLPGFSLQATLSDSGQELDQLLKGSPLWSLLGQLTAPLFNSGRLKAQAEIAQLDAELSYLKYQQTLLEAVNEVDNRLDLEATLAQQEKALARALEHSQTSLDHYRSLYRDGVGDILNLLNAEQTAFEARIQLLQVRQNRLSNRITLGLALGMSI